MIQAKKAYSHMYGNIRFPRLPRMSKKRVKAFSLVTAPPNSIEESRSGLSLATDWITIVPREIPAKWEELILR